jgi:uncharacterized repeat protein (TIGR03803 family)
MNHSNAWKAACAILLFCAVATISASAQLAALTTLLSFDGTNGSNPSDVLVQGFDGNFYGTTPGGGAQSSGTIYKITPEGVITTLHNFCSETKCVDGSSPQAGLLLATDGNFYGTTSEGGTTSNGTIFRITPSGVLTTLHSFCGIDGAEPYGRLIQGNDGKLYGTTKIGGALNSGTVFRITTTGSAFTRLHSFCSQTNCADGQNPTGGLLQEKGGDFYGTTFGSLNVGGSQGTVFKMTLAGALTTLHTFSGTDGANPSASLMQHSDGVIYGTTEFGGAGSCPSLPEPGCGTIFAISPAGHLTTVHSFMGGDGGDVVAGVVQGYNGFLNGTTVEGMGIGLAGNGTLYESSLTVKGLSLFLNFCVLQETCSNGAHPRGGIIQGTDGNFYGTTELGGTACPTAGCGTVFKWSYDVVDNPPFVEALVNHGIVGSSVVLLGNQLGNMYVEFNGTFAASTVVSDTEIIATVPAGATTGYIKVVTANGARTLRSNLPFRVTPQVFSFLPASGAVGTTVVITGESLTGATAVTFPCAKTATFTVDSDTQITATVPAGAMTGEIGVFTPGGNVGSSTVFTVTP